MTIILVFGAAAGAILGFRHFKVWALAPLIIFSASGVVAVGVSIGLDRHSLMLGLLAAVVVPQIGYLMSCMRSLATQQQSRSDLESGVTAVFREQELLFSNYKNHVHNRAALARIRLEGEAAIQPDAATAPVALNQKHPAKSALHAVSGW